MNNLEQNVIKLVKEKGLISEGDKILVALSGGPDSVFLLTFLQKYKKKYKIELGAFHLNHMLRGKHSDKDEEFCRTLCNENKIFFISRKVDIRKAAAENKISIEEAGRNLRYEALETIADESGYTKIATGHNLDDNTETVFLNLIKGTGLKGISGIPYKRGIIIRPLLSSPKPAILEYLEESGIAYILDKSNKSPDFERNFLRNKILPSLRNRINPSLDEAVLRSSDIFKEYSHFIERKISQGVEYTSDRGEEIKIILRKFGIVDDELKKGIIKNVIERNFMTSLTFKDILSVLFLTEKEAGKSIILRNNIKVVRDRDYLTISYVENEIKSQQKIHTGEKIETDGMTLTIEEWKGKVEYSDNRNVEYINGDYSGDEFIVREWESGDRFRPIGMKGSVKVSDFLNSIKVPSSEKKGKLVLTKGNEIIWVIGSRINENYKIKKNTRRVLKLCLM